MIADTRGPPTTKSRDARPSERGTCFRAPQGACSVECVSSRASLVESAAILLASPDLPAALSGVAERLRRHADVLRMGVAVDQPGEPWLRVIDVHGDGSGPAEQGGALMPRLGTANGRVVASGKPYGNDDVANSSVFVEERVLVAAGARAYYCLPATFGGRVLGTLNVALRRLPTDADDLLQTLRALGDLLGAALERDRLSGEVQRLAAALRRRSEALDHDLDRVGATRPVAKSDAFRRVLREVERAAAVDLPVLLLGETGTGKEVLARHLHRCGPRADGPFVVVNCAALPDALAESELFGVRRGAYTGAETDRLGVFAAAHGGTLFLDEVGELSLATQAKLLRAVQEGEVTPLGASAPMRVDLRLVAATHRDLARLTTTQGFRADLYHRLAALPIQVPPLAQRREDIPDLVREFVRAAAARMHRDAPAIGDTLLRVLAARHFPGNVRELRNLVERAVVFSNEILVLPDDQLPQIAPGQASGPAVGDADWPTLDQAQAAHIRATLHRTQGRVYGPHGAAALLGVPGSTLKSRMERLGMA
ncbi:MAG: sigma 54-interacting transcriptional regulator [Planctomycetota bacterium]